MKDISKDRTRENKRDKYKVVKALSLAFLILVTIEGYLWFLDENEYFGEPYLWRSRNIVAYHINECKELFSQPARS